MRDRGEIGVARGQHEDFRGTNAAILLLLVKYKTYGKMINIFLMKFFTFL